MQNQLCKWGQMCSLWVVLSFDIFNPCGRSTVRPRLSKLGSSAAQPEEGSYGAQTLLLPENQKMEGVGDGGRKVKGQVGGSGDLSPAPSRSAAGSTSRAQKLKVVRQGEGRRFSGRSGSRQWLEALQLGQWAFVTNCSLGLLNGVKKPGNPCILSQWTMYFVLNLGLCLCIVINY